MTVRNIKRYANGGFKIDVNNIPKLMAAYPAIKKGALEAIAEVMEESMEERFDQKGPGWPPKTFNLAGPDTTSPASPLDFLSEGQTPALREAVESVVVESDDEALIGYMSDEEHPHPGIFGQFRESQVPSITDVAIAHEFGVAEGGSVNAPSPWHWTAEGGASGSPVRVPARPIVSLAADKDGFKALSAGTKVLDDGIGKFNTLPRVD